LSPSDRLRVASKMKFNIEYERYETCIPEY
jgi:hypothetical protein